MSLTDRRGFIGALAAASATPLASTQGLADQNSKTSGANEPDINFQMAGSPADRSSEAIFNVRDYGATGQRSDEAKPSIQKAINACATAGGGTVYLPPGEYTCGGLKLLSHVRLYLEAGATLFAADDPRAYDLIEVSFFGHNDAPSTAALFQGDGLEDISIEGRGTVDGQAKYIWRPDNTEHSFDHKALMVSSGKSIMRSYPEGFPTRNVYPHLVWLRGCTNVDHRPVVPSFS